MRKQGVIVRWDDMRGFGFVRSAESHADVFLHARELPRAYQGRLPGVVPVGQPVTFEELHVGGKGPRATAVRIASNVDTPAAAVPRPVADRTAIHGGRRHDDGPPRRAAPARRAADSRWMAYRSDERPARATDPTGVAGTAGATGTAMAGMLVLIYTVALGWAVSTRLLPWWVVPASGLLNFATFFAYWQDKYAARQGAWRIAETTLHLWALAGGWIGAGAAQRILRHKSRKVAFRTTYRLTTLIHVAAVGALLWWLHRGGRWP